MNYLLKHSRSYAHDSIDIKFLDQNKMTSNYAVARYSSQQRVDYPLPKMHF